MYLYKAWTWSEKKKTLWTNTSSTLKFIFCPPEALKTQFKVLERGSNVWRFLRGCIVQFLITRFARSRAKKPTITVCATSGSAANLSEDHPPLHRLAHRCLLVCSFLCFVLFLFFDKSQRKKNLNRMTASVLKQDPNTKRFKRTLIYFNIKY